jgi:hypothetical protein
MEFLMIVGALAFLAFCVWAGLMLDKARRAQAQRDRRHLIEAEMRQDIIDAKTQKDVADKILREAGESR